MMDFSEYTLRTAMVVAFVALTTLSVVRGEISCTDDQDCPFDKYCYNISRMCVDYTPCSRYHRVEGANPARHSSQCGPCYPGYIAGLLATGVEESVCTKTITSEGTETESTEEFNWSWYWVAVSVSVLLLFIILLVIAFRKLVCAPSRDKFCNKMIPWSVRPTAPPQDEASLRLRQKPYLVDEERPPIYSSVIGPNVDRNNLVNAAPFGTPLWVTKPNYEHDFNDNVADGVAIPIHTSSNNHLQMDFEEEEETNPSSWTPGQMTVEVPSRPFARFGLEQQENMQNNVLLRANCSSNSTRGESSDEASGIPEEPSGSRSQGDVFCGPNVQINQTITLNIGKNSSK